MRGALVLSAAVHLGLLAGALIALNWPEAFDPASVESISVDLVRLEDFTSTAESATQNSALENMIATGAEPVAPSVAEPVDEAEPFEPRPAATTDVAALEPVDAEPVRADAPVPVQAQPVVTIEVASAAVLSAKATPVDSVEGILTDKTLATAETVAAVVPASVVPALHTATLVSPAETQVVEAVDPEAPPVPQVRTAQQTTEPIVEQKRAPVPREPPKDPPKKKPAPPKVAAPPPPGSGGNSNANAQASAPSGGEGQSDAAGNAAVSKYPGQVQARLRRALRYPKGARGTGEVRVQFVVAASGSVSGVAVVQSSGTAAFDTAALETVRRAAPFPPIPAAAGKSTWTFVVPLAFTR